MRLILILLLSFFSNIAINAKNIDKTNQQEFVKHKITSGDNMSYLADKYNVSSESIRKANNLSNNNIKIGQELKIPKNKDNNLKKEENANKNDKKEQKSEPKKKNDTNVEKNNNKQEKSEQKKEEYMQYKIEKGDSLLGLAVRFDVSSESIKKANNLSNNNIKIGQKIKISKNAFDEYQKKQKENEKNKDTTKEEKKEVIIERTPEKITQTGKFILPITDGQFIEENTKCIKFNITKEVSVKASDDGVILYIGQKNDGEKIIITQNKDLYLIYVGMDEVLTNQGKVLKQGDFIGKTKSGNLSLCLRKNGEFIKIPL